MKPSPSWVFFLPEQAGYCLFSHSSCMCRLLMNLPRLSMQEREKHWEFAILGRNSCFRLEGGVRKEGWELVLLWIPCWYGGENRTGCDFGHSVQYQNLRIFERFQVTRCPKAFLTEKVTCLRDRNLKVQQLLWPWAGNFGLRGKQQQRTRSSLWWRSKACLDCSDFLLCADSTELGR